MNRDSSESRQIGEYIMANPARMSKTDLIEYGKKLGFKVDKDMTKKDILTLIKSKPTKIKIVGKPVTQSKVKTITTPQPKDFWQSVKGFFGV